MDYMAVTARNLQARQKANRRERDTQFTLPVHLGKTQRRPMDQPTFDHFQATLSRAVLDNAMSAQPTLLVMLYTYVLRLEF